MLVFSQSTNLPPDPCADLGVHTEEVDSGSANIGEPDDLTVLSCAEMLAPTVGAGMEQACKETGIRIQA